MVAVADAMTVDAAPIACTVEAIKAARKQADAHVKAGAYAAAIALLDSDTCLLDADQPAPLQAQIAWRMSDLSFAYYKAGNYGACYGIAAAQTTPYIGNIGSVFDEGDAVMRALDYNAKLCLKAAEKERGPFVGADPCPFDENAFAIPGGGCLAFEAGKEDADGLLECGPVVVRDRKGGKRTVLELDGGNLADGSVCCNVQSVSFGKRPGARWAVLVVTEGKDCNGGTASSEEQHAYVLKGTKLELVHTLRAIAH